MINFLSMFDQALFPNERSEIYVLNAKMPKSLGDGMLSYVSDAQIANENAGHLLKGYDLPAGKSFFFIFSEGFVEPPTPREDESFKVDDRIIFWAICVGIIWVKVRKMYIQEILMCLERGRITPAHFLTVDEIADAVAPYQKYGVKRIASNMESLCVEDWRAHGQEAILKVGRDVAIMACKEAVECKTMGALAPWCKTEENALAFLRSCKKILWSEL